MADQDEDWKAKYERSEASRHKLRDTLVRLHSPLIKENTGVCILTKLLNPSNFIFTGALSREDFKHRAAFETAR